LPGNALYRPDLPLDPNVFNIHLTTGMAIGQWPPSERVARMH
jgi:hypothetical protein